MSSTEIRKEKKGIYKAHQIVARRLRVNRLSTVELSAGIFIRSKVVSNSLEPVVLQTIELRVV